MLIVVTLVDVTLAVPLLFLCLMTWAPPDHRITGRALVLLFITACGLTAWTKFSGFILVTGLAAVLLLQDLLRHRRPYISAGILAAMMFFWLLAGQSFSGLIPFLRTSLAIALTYSEAAATGGQYWLVPVGAFVCAATVGIVALSLWQRDALREWPSLLWISVYLFLGFKETFVRQDSLHLLLGMTGCLLPGSLVIMTALPSTQGAAGRSMPHLLEAASKIGWASVLVLCCVLSIYEIGAATATASGRSSIKDAVWNAQAFFLQPTPGARAAVAQHYRDEVRRSHPIGALSGTADFFPNNAGFLAVNGIPMRLRPVPQAFVAFNEYLSGMNASLLRGPNRPDYVVFDIDPIAGRHPLIEDTLSVLALLSCFEPASFTGQYLLLKAAGCLDIRFSPLLDTTIQPGQPVEIPASAKGVVWAEIDAGFSRLETLSKTLLHARPLRLDIQTDEAHFSYELPRELARTGFLVSPHIADPVSFGLLYRQPVIGSAVRSFTVDWSPRTTRALFRRPVGVRLFTLNLPGRGQTGLPSSLLLQFAASVHSKGGLSSRPDPPAWVVADGEPRIRVNSSSTGTVEIGEETAGLEIRYGLQNRCDEPAESLSRVRFSASWYSRSSAFPVTLLDRIAEAGTNQDFSGEVKLSLPDAPGRLILRTEPAGSSCFEGAWWSGLGPGSLTSAAEK